MKITRREFNRLAGLAAITRLGGLQNEQDSGKSTVALVKGKGGEAGFQKAFDLLDRLDLEGREIYLKCTFNSGDPFPATTNPESIRAVTNILRKARCGKITLVERSGMGETRQILEALGIMDLALQLQIDLLPLETLSPSEWKKADLPGSNWKNGVEIPRFLDSNSCVVQICNLKTHRFGAVFSASLKNSIGLIAKYSPQNSQVNYMRELHSSPVQGRMIAEVNQVYSPQIVFMDATQVFIKGGPESGVTAEPGIIAASRDRVALDAAGFALLRHSGADYPIEDQKPVFSQEQIKRAAELGLGARSGKDMVFLTDDIASRGIAARLEYILNENLPS
jgi:uncharacterized protein (DUF362 family)